MNLYIELLQDLKLLTEQQNENENTNNQNQENQTDETESIDKSLIWYEKIKKVFSSPSIKRFFNLISDFNRRILQKLLKWRAQIRVKRLNQKAGILNNIAFAFLSFMIFIVRILKRVFSSIPQRIDNFVQQHRYEPPNAENLQMNNNITNNDILIEFKLLNPLNLLKSVGGIFAAVKSMNKFGDFLVNMLFKKPINFIIALVSFIATFFIGFLIVSKFYPEILPKKVQNKFENPNFIKRIAAPFLNLIPESVKAKLGIRENKFLTFLRKFKSGNFLKLGFLKKENAEIYLEEVFGLISKFIKKLFYLTGLSAVLTFGLKLLLDFLDTSNKNLFTRLPVLRTIKRVLDEMYNGLKNRLNTVVKRDF